MVGVDLGRFDTRSAALVAALVVGLFVAVPAIEYRRSAILRQADAEPWTVLIDRVDGALDRGDLRAARRALDAASAAAAHSRTWQGLIAIGDAQRRLAIAAGHPTLAMDGARANYQAALTRARAERSLDGVLRATLAFASLGDEALVTVGLRVAWELTPTDRVSQAEMWATAARLEVLAMRVAARR